MIIDILFLGGYGHFVWPVFIFAFMSYFLLYLKTNKELQDRISKLKEEMEDPWDDEDDDGDIVTRL